MSCARLRARTHDLHRRIVVVSVTGRRDVIAHAEDEIALGVEVQPGAADVSRGAAGGTAREQRRVAGDLHLGDPEDDALGARHHRGTEIVEREPADLVVPDHGRVAGRREVGARRVVDVEVALVRIGEVEARLEAHAQHAVLGGGVVRADRDRRDDRVVVRRPLGVVHAHVAGQVVRRVRAVHVGPDLAPVDLAVRGDVDGDRAVRVRDEDFARVARPHRARAVGVVALAGQPADAADDLLDEVVVAAVLGVRGAEVAQGRHPGAAIRVALRRRRAVLNAGAVVALAPRDRMVLSHRGRAGRVRRLVQRREHMMRTANVALEGVVLVAELVRIGKVARREMGVIGDLNRGPVGDVGRGVNAQGGADDRVRTPVPPVPRHRRRPHVGAAVVGADAAALLDEIDDRRPLAAVKF